MDKKTKASLMIIRNLNFIPENVSKETWKCKQTIFFDEVLAAALTARDP